MTSSAVRSNAVSARGGRTQAVVAAAAKVSRADLIAFETGTKRLGVRQLIRIGAVIGTPLRRMVGK